MLVFVTSDTSPSARWAPLSLCAKSALPIEELAVVAGQCRAQPPRQLTCIGGHVKASAQRTLLVLPLSSSSAVASAPAIQVLEVGEGAAQLVADVKACFPSLVRKNRMEDDSDEDDDSDDDDDDRSKQHAAQTAQEAQAATANAAAVAAYVATTRVRVVASIEALEEVYAFADDVNRMALRQDVNHHLGTGLVQFLCIDLPAHAPTPMIANNKDANPLHFGVVLVHDLPPQRESRHLLHIPLLREPRGFFPVDEEDEQQNGRVVFQDATVFTLNARRESTVHGGGKTPAETVKNIRLRHASGTFCTLVYPTTTWVDVVDKHSAVVPPLRALAGELRSRRFMGTVPNAPTTILLESEN